MRRIALCLLLCGAAWAQKGEVGVAGGYGTYRSGTVIAPLGTVEAGIRNRFTLGAVLCEDLYEYVGGELRWTFQDGDPYVSTAALKSNIQGQSHAFNFDLLFYARPAGARLRPYVAVGGGLKLFRITGPTPAGQSLGEIATLTGDSEVLPMGSFGGGVKYYLGQKIALRVDFRDFVSAFPKGVIKPAPGGTGRGLLHQFTPLIGISYVIR